MTLAQSVEGRNKAKLSVKRDSLFGKQDERRVAHFWHQF